KWHRDITGGVTAEAAVKGDLLYFGAGDGFFYALDAQTGTTRWTFPIRSEGIGAPLVTDEAVYFLTGTNSAYALNPETGSQIWFYNRQDSNAITIRGASEPTIYNGRVYIGFSDGYLVALDKTKGVMIWEKQLSTGQRFRDVDSKPVVEDGKIYVSSYDGQLFCLNADSGQTVWTHDDGGFLPVTIVGGTVYYSTSSRKMQAIEKETGKVIWSVDLANTVGSQPTFYRGLILFGEWSGKLRAIDARNGEAVISFNTGRGVTSGVTVDTTTDRLYVMTLDANIYSLKLRLKKQSEYLPWEI
ncbi:MAG: PQQ-binding-like beta-propeller repeat protein, partial [Verrucomicrobiota bacterium]